jgi:hypothetical protein
MKKKYISGAEIGPKQPTGFRKAVPKPMVLPMLPEKKSQTAKDSKSNQYQRSIEL